MLRPKHQIELERHEAKYLIHPSQVSAIREFVRPFVYADPNAIGRLPTYTVTTLQLDTHDLALYRAKEFEALNRFKLRCRTYGIQPEKRTKVFLEIKRKIKGVIVKSRASLPPEEWDETVCVDPKRQIEFKSKTELFNYLNFVRLVKQIHARPVMLIRYERESYLGKFDNYSRLTFDWNLRYSPARTWDLWPGGDVKWRSMDSTVALNRPYSGVVLELKTFSDAPEWMVDLTERFDLVRVGFCKYFTAIRLESFFDGAMYSEASENCSYG